MSVDLENLKNEFEKLMEKSDSDRISISYAPDKDEFPTDMGIMVFFDQEKVETALVEEEDYGELDLEDVVDFLIEEKEEDNHE